MGLELPYADRQNSNVPNHLAPTNHRQNNNAHPSAKIGLEASQPPSWRPEGPPDSHRHIFGAPNSIFDTILRPFWYIFCIILFNFGTRFLDVFGRSFQYVLQNYIDIGEDELDISKLSTVVRAKYGSINAAQERLGTVGDIKEVFIDFQKNLYLEIPA